MVNFQNIQVVQASDLQKLANNKAVAKNLRDIFPNPYTLDHAKQFLTFAQSGAAGYVFGIFNNSTFIGIGSIIPQADVDKVSAEIGYWLGEPFWAKGYGTTVVKLLTDYAFKELRLLRIYMIKDTVIMDKYIYSMLSSNWNNL